MKNIFKLSDHSYYQGRKSVDTEAIDWIVRLDNEYVSEEELNEYYKWINRSSYHREALRKAHNSWNELDALCTIIDPINLGDLIQLKKTKYIPIFSYSVVTIILIISSFIFIISNDKIVNESTEYYSTEYKTAIGELKTVYLPDGTSVKLNTDSSIFVKYSENFRIISQNKGEAWFNVVHNESQPFLVYVGKYVVRAVGTAFTVYLNQDAIEITVTEGQVKIEPAQESLHSIISNHKEVTQEEKISIPLIKGQNLRLDHAFDINFNQNKIVQKLEIEDLKNKMSWREGMLSFEDEPLIEVITEINRYTETQIIITEDELKDLRFGGYFKVSDIESILDSLEEGFNIRVEKAVPHIIYLSTKKEIPN